MYWKQRAKSFWVKGGDLNTKYFHAIASSQKRCNHIHKLYNATSVSIEKLDDICDKVKNYFTNLFAPTREVSYDAINVLSKKISEEDNNFLIAPFSLKEFKAAIFFYACG